MPYYKYMALTVPCRDRQREQDRMLFSIHAGSESDIGIAMLEKICNGFWIPENIRFTVNVDARVLQKI